MPTAPAPDRATIIANVFDYMADAEPCRSVEAEQGWQPLPAGCAHMAAINEAAYAFGKKYPPAPQPKPALLYLAGPLTKGDQQANAEKAHVTAGWLMREADRMGLVLAVFIPHAYLSCDAAFPRDYEAWMASLDVVLQRADALFRLPGDSPGSDRETARASALGIPIYRHTIAEATQMLAWLASLPAETPR